MEVLKGLAVGVWHFVSNPPVEVTQAAFNLANNTAKCVAENISAFAQAVLDAFKGVL